jgi:hypothetical protein
MTLLKIMLILHIVGDFHTQSDQMSEKKKNQKGYLLLHVVFYTAPFIIFFALIDKWIVTVCFLAVLFVTHWITDLIKVSYESRRKQTFKTFLVDQCAHIVVLYLSWLFVKDHFAIPEQIGHFLEFLGVAGVSGAVLSVMIVILTALRPTSNLIELMLPNGQPEIQGAIDGSDGTNYGALIGYLERMTIVLLGLMNLWSSIALVITAKSIARFRQLEEKDFAQKYLIGTLLSLSITLGLLYVFIY